MTKASKTIAASLLILLALPVLPEHAGAADQGFNGFWHEFQKAMQTNDTQKIASMTRFPFLFQNKQLNKAQFTAQIEKIFPAKTRHCLATGHPTTQKGEYYVFCGELIYTFSRVHGQYMFTDIGVND